MTSSNKEADIRGPELSSFEQLDLIDSTSFFREAVLQSPSSIVITDLEGKIRFVNPKFEELTGYTQDDVIDQNPRVLNSGYTPLDGYKELWETILGGNTWRGVFRNRKKNGDMYWEAASISPLRDSQNCITHFMAIKEDITARRANEERLRGVLRILNAKQSEINKALEDARATQQYLMPRHFPVVGKSRAFARSIPTELVGGDFFDVATMDDDRMAILVADVTGHGVSAALISFLLAAEFRNALARGFHPQNILQSVNDALLHTIPDGQFASAVVGVLDAQRGTWEFSVAGHPDLLVYRAQYGEVEPVTTDGMLLGMVSSEQAGFENKRVDLESGDVILAYSDAFIEASDLAGTQMGIHGLSELFKDVADYPLEDMVDQIFSSTLQYADTNVLDDDATIVALRFERP